MPPLRLVFLGSDPIALPLLNWLAGEGSAVAQVVAIFTQPDRATGRGQKIQPNGIKTWALERQLPVLQPEKLTAEVREQLAGFEADVALVMAYGHILRDEFIATPRLGTLNLHTSILPKYRGASPIQSAVACGERETGVTLMRIVRKLDAGPIADVARVPVGALDTAIDLEAKLAAACVPLLARALPRLADGSLPFGDQDEAQATFCRKLQKEDGVLDFQAPAAAIAARVNGLFPWPSCTVELNGEPVKLGLADVVSGNVDSEVGRGVSPSRGSGVAIAGSLPRQARDAERVESAGTVRPTDSAAPGTVLGADADGLYVRSGDGVVRFRRLQRPGGRMLPAADFLRGFSVSPGTVIPSRPMPPLVTKP